MKISFALVLFVLLPMDVCLAQDSITIRNYSLFEAERSLLYAGYNNKLGIYPSNLNDSLILTSQNLRIFPSDNYYVVKPKFDSCRPRSASIMILKIDNTDTSLIGTDTFKIVCARNDIRVQLGNITSQETFIDSILRQDQLRAFIPESYYDFGIEIRSYELVLIKEHRVKIINSDGPFILDSTKKKIK